MMSFDRPRLTSEHELFRADGHDIGSIHDAMHVICETCLVNEDALKGWKREQRGHQIPV